MLTPSQHRVFLIASTVLAMFLLSFLDYPKGPEPHQNKDEQRADQRAEYSQGWMASYAEKYSKYCDEEPGEKNSKWLHHTACEKSTEVVIAIFTVVLAFATLALIGTGIVQWAETRKTAQRQLRAYISVYPGFIFEQDDRRGGFFEARPQMKNCGQTPAYKVMFTGITRALPNPLPPNFNFGDPADAGLSVSTLGPGQENTMYPFTERFYVPHELEAILRMRGVALHTYGIVTYMDAFKEKRWTKFHYLFLWGSAGLPIWLISNQYNDAT